LARNSAAAESEGGQKFLPPPTPFLFARPSVQFGARSAPSVPFKKGSDFVKQTHKNIENKEERGMENKFSVLTLTAIVFLLLLGCEALPEKEKFIGIEAYHDTRVKVICEVGKGKFTERTIHRFQAAVCGADVVKAEEYLNGKRKYGPLPGCEERYNAYLESKKKKE
jgi:hypothetical protein